jgi:hypothetical protein
MSCSISEPDTLLGGLPNIDLFDKYSVRTLPFSIQGNTVKLTRRIGFQPN